MTEIEKYPNSDIRIKMFDKKSSDFCFEKSRELLSKPFNIDLPSSFGAKHFDKKTRDLIGENLLEIENTLKALNLDFLQTYNDLEKTDSAETLFGDNYSYENNPKIRNSTKISKLAATNPFSPSLDQQQQNDLFNEISRGISKLDSPKSFSRRDSQKSNYSPQEPNFSPREINFPNFINSKTIVTTTSSSSPIRTSNNSIHSANYPYNNLINSRRIDDENCQMPNRQRSMSFTENYNLKSPQLSDIPVTNYRQPKAPIIAHKPKSIRARNLRRLSYNPIIIDSSSTSSDDDNEFDRSIAHSECDIRSKMFATAKRKRQYLNRKSTIGQDKLYGSNASIKSAPQYNYQSEQNVLFNYNNLQENIYDFSGGINLFEPSAQKYLNKEPTPAFNPDLLFSEFDVTKLTGKSPTTQSYFHTNNFIENSTTTTTTKKPINSIPLKLNEPSTFRWPEKIHGSTVKQNDLIWQRRQVGSSQHQLFDELNFKQKFSSDDSSTETDSIDFRREFVPRMPPSPAP